MMIRHHFHLTCLLVIIITPNNVLPSPATVDTVDDGNDDISDVSRDNTADINESRIAPDGHPSSRHVRNTDDQEHS